jgi:iron complex outermembrane receptor protein
MEFTFGQYGDPLIDPQYGTGFKSKNIGNTRIRGVEISLMGQGKMGAIDVTALVGYTYIDPRQTDFIDSIHGPTTSTGTSLLKYRYEHSGKGDIEFGYKKISTGFSLRANSNMANIDKFFEEPYFFPGMKEYRVEHNKGDVICDYRLSYQVHEKIKISFIINNIFNREVMGRPADIQPPRVFAVQLSAKF